MVERGNAAQEREGNDRGERWRRNTRTRSSKGRSGGRKRENPTSGSASSTDGLKRRRVGCPSRGLHRERFRLCNTASPSRPRNYICRRLVLFPAVRRADTRSAKRPRNRFRRQNFIRSRVLSLRAKVCASESYE